MNIKQWIKTSLLTALIILSIVELTNYIIDPFQQYRKATIYPFWYGGIKNERFHIAGLVKNYEYNSIMIGSSMVENFLISDLQKLIPNPIKLCMSGARANEIFITLNTAYKYRKIDNIILGLDIYALTGEIDQKRKNTEFPLYLYDSNPFNDVKYLLSLNTLQESKEALFNQKLGADKILYQYEHMYEWQYHDNNKFGKDKVLNIWGKRVSSFNQKEWSIAKLKKSYEYNILSIIKNHPETKFYIFYPPYSALAYLEWEKQGVSTNVIELKKYIYKTLSKYSNVELYDFQVAKQIVLNLDNYKDSQHYHQKINTWMIDQMINKNFLINKNNIEKYLKTFQKEIKLLNKKDLNAL